MFLLMSTGRYRPPAAGSLKIEIEMQNGRKVVIFKHAIYSIEEAPEPIIAPKKR